MGILTENTNRATVSCQSTPAHSWPHLSIFHIVQHVSVTNFSSSDQSCPCSSSAEPMVGSSQGSVRVVLSEPCLEATTQTHGSGGGKSSSLWPVLSSYSAISMPSSWLTLRRWSLLRL